MSDQAAHTIVIVVALLWIGILAGAYVLKGGDGAALTAGISSITAVLGFEFGTYRPTP